VLVLADCDVLPDSVVQRVLAFQKNGGIVVGDERSCPAIAPDVLLPVYERTKHADADKQALQERARVLRDQLGTRYRGYVDSTQEDALPYRRAYGTSDYVFVVNDRREFGSYVGQHGLVMENGLPTTTDITINRAAGFVYDLVEHRSVSAKADTGTLRVSADLEPGGGKIWLVTERPIEVVSVQAPETVKCGDTVAIAIAVTDAAGAPVDAVVPMEVTIRDPDGRPAEFSGYYGARDGKLSIEAVIATNDVLGMWSIEVRELASGLLKHAYFRMTQ